MDDTLIATRLPIFAFTALSIIGTACVSAVSAPQSPHSPASSCGPDAACPPVVISAGLSVHHFDLSHRSISGMDASGQRQIISAAPLGSLRAETLDVQMGGLAGPVFLGIEVEGGSPWTGSTERATVGAAPFGIAGGSYIVSGGLVVGVVVPRLGPIGGRLEMYAGAAKLFLVSDVGSQPNYDCDFDGCRSAPNVVTWLLEPRLRMTIWASRWFSIDAWGGYGVGPSQGDWSAGLSLSHHGRPFDDARDAGATP